MEKKKILISVYLLKDIGGISSACYNLINEIHSIYNVHLCVLSNCITSRYIFPSDVTIVKGSDALKYTFIEKKLLGNLNFLNKVKYYLFRILWLIFGYRLIRAEISRIKVKETYDAALAFSDFRYKWDNAPEYLDYTFINKCVSAKRKIVWVHNDPIKSKITPENANYIFNKFDRIINVSSDCKMIFDQMAPILIPKSFVVYNMYNIKSIKEKAYSNNNMFFSPKKIHFVTVARISNQQKRIDRILSVVIKLKRNGIDNFEWIVVGEGEDRLAMQNQVKSDGIDDLIRFVGLKSNPYPFIKQADAFVLSSLYEGLPVTVKESQILEVPTLVTNFGSAKEAVIDGKQGCICENSTEGLYNMIKNIILHPEKLKEYKEYLHNNPVDNQIAIKQLNSVLND